MVLCGDLKHGASVCECESARARVCVCVAGGGGGVSAPLLYLQGCRLVVCGWVECVNTDKPPVQNPQVGHLRTDLTPTTFPCT